MPDYDGRVIYSCTDAHGVIDVVDEATVRSLHFGTQARQSTMFFHDRQALALVYTRCMMTCLLFADQPRSVLLLGVGGGSLPKFLRHHFPHCRIDAVEKRKKVVELARTYFYLAEDPLLRIHHMDAADFLGDQPEDPYDLVLVDIHDPDGMSSAVGAERFFAACQQRLHRRGILSINLWSGEHEEVLNKVRHNLENSFAQQVMYLPVARKRNCIGLAFNYELPQGLIKALRRRSIELGPRFGIEFPELLRDLQKANPRSLGRRFF